MKWHFRVRMETMDGETLNKRFDSRRHAMDYITALLIAWQTRKPRVVLEDEQGCVIEKWGNWEDER